MLSGRKLDILSPSPLDIEIEDIRTRRKEGATYKEIMEIYDISKSHVSYIINGKTRVGA